MYNGSPERNITYKWKDATEHILWAKLRLTTLWVSGLLPSLSGHSYITLMTVWPVKGCMLGLHLRIFLCTVCVCEQISFLCPYIVSGQYSWQFRKLFFLRSWAAAGCPSSSPVPIETQKWLPQSVPWWHSDTPVLQAVRESDTNNHERGHGQDWRLETRPPPMSRDLILLGVFERKVQSAPIRGDFLLSSCI